MIPYFDAHCDTVSACVAEGSSLRCRCGHVDLRRGCALPGYAQFFALYHDAAKAPPDGMWAQCCRLHDAFCRQMAENSSLVLPCATGAQVDAALSRNRVAALLSIEGADMLACDPARLVVVAGWGVRLMNPVWNRQNVLSGTHLEDPQRGLSPDGVAFLREMERCSIYPDVSHLSDPGFWDVIRRARGPVVASHSNARAVCPHRRNLTDDQFCAIRDSGGVVGLNFYQAFVGGESMDALIAHLEHFLALGGEKTVCLGGDLDGCSPLAAGLRGVEDVPLLYHALVRRGYGQALLRDIFWNNLRRLI